MFNKNSTSARAAHGFTMIELVMVMVLAGILAIAVIPRFASKNVFDTRGFFDQSIAMLRYAQKVAIAQRTDVFVNVDAASGKICLTYVADNSCTSLVSTVSNPADRQRFLVTAPAGVTLTASVVFSFSPLGRPSAGQTIMMTGDGVTQTIKVEAETGYVHL